MEREKNLLGFWDATAIGVGAIVGGGILALAGVAFATTGNGAIAAFALNGLIALLTAASCAELATAFPESGGAYTFAKKVLSVRTAFAVGWIAWFASIVAGVLYALGFASYILIALRRLYAAFTGNAPPWFNRAGLRSVPAVAATLIYSLALFKQSKGGKQWATIGKIILFAILIVSGFWAMNRQPASYTVQALSPFFPAGPRGLFLAMGYTFIALQGFEFIAVVGGELKDPQRVIPRAMFLSLGVALAVYLPLLLVMSTAGTKGGESIQAISAKNPETVIAIAAQNYLGEPGFWLVTIAAVLAMLSALRANLLAASWVALSMGRDRTLPRQLGRLHKIQGTPAAAVLATAGATTVLLLLIPDTAAAGAAASLIFLVCFALIHLMAILARKRAGSRQPPFKTPWFPLFPALGFCVCIALAVSQGIAVPSAGVITLVWLGCGGALFLALFARQALIADASAEAWDPHLLKVRGRNPLILVPIANPDNSAAMVTMADALSPPNVGRVLLLSVVPLTHPDPATRDIPKPLADSQRVLEQSLLTSYKCGINPEALITMAQNPLHEIRRVADAHRCESLLLGLSDLQEEIMGTRLEKLIGEVDCDVIILRPPKDGQGGKIDKIVVPIRGRGKHDMLRARLLTSLCRTGEREVAFVRIVPENTPRKACKKIERELLHLAADEVRGCSPRTELVKSDNVGEELTRQAAQNDLIVLGLQREGPGRKIFGEIVLRIARNTRCAIIMLGRRG